MRKPHGLLPSTDRAGSGSKLQNDSRTGWSGWHTIGTRRLNLFTGRNEGMSDWSALGFLVACLAMLCGIGRSLAILERAQALADEVRLLQDPNAVHINMLRGSIAKPSVGQIIHLYGRETLLAALEPEEH